jgi:hypothetical protein
MATVSSLNDLINSGRAWLEAQASQAERLRPMLAIAAIVLFFGFLAVVVGWVSDSVNNVKAAQAELSSLTQQLKEGSWPQRKQQSETLKFQLNERLWTAETAGLAEASMERWLRERIEKSNVRADSIRVQRAALQGSADGGLLNGAQRMTAKIVMPFEPESLLQILREIASNDKILIVDRLLVRSGRNPLIEMDVSTFLILPGEGR